MINVDQPHQQFQMCKAPAIILIAMTQQQCWQRNIHFLSCCKEQWQQQMNAREECNGSHATINLSCCCSQNAMTTIPRHATTSGTSMPRSSTASTPKMACMLPKASTVRLLYSMYVLEGKYSKYERPHLSRKVTTSLSPQRQVIAYVMSGDNKLH